MSRRELLFDMEQSLRVALERVSTDESSLALSRPMHGVTNRQLWQAEIERLLALVGEMKDCHHQLAPYCNEAASQSLAA